MDKSTPLTRQHQFYLWVLITILLGQIIFLSFRLADQSMWTDEMFTYCTVHTPTLTGALDHIRVTENRPPLHFLLLWGWARLVGPSEWSTAIQACPSRPAGLGPVA